MCELPVFSWIPFFNVLICVLELTIQVQLFARATTQVSTKCVHVDFITAIVKATPTLHSYQFSSQVRDELVSHHLTREVVVLVESVCHNIILKEFGSPY